jgi:EmrB/QacA subfamily drug resistance transporter
MGTAPPSRNCSGDMQTGTGPALQLSRREIVVIMIGAMISMFLSALDQNILGPTLPKISAELNGGSSISWIVSGYLLGSTASTPIYGKLSDLYGRKLILQIAIVTFLLTSVLCALATSMTQLIGFRMLQGIGGGGLISMVFSVLGDIVSPRERGKYQAYLAGGFAVSAILGPVLGGVFADDLSWRWIFWINIPIGLVALVMCEITLAKLTILRVRHKIDYLGALLIVATASCAMLVITLGGHEMGWASPRIWALGAAGIILLALSVAQELRTSTPMLPPRLFRNHTFVVTNLATFLNFSCQAGIIAFLPSFLQLVYGFSAAGSGLMMIPSLLVLPLAGVIIGRSVARTGRYKHFPLIGQATATIGALLLFSTRIDTARPLVLACMMVCCVGTGVGGILALTLQNAIEHRDLGAGTAAWTLFRNLGSSFGVALFGSIFIARADFLVGLLPLDRPPGGSPGMLLLRAGPDALSGFPATLQGAAAAAILGAFHQIFLAAAGISVLAFAITWFLRELPMRQSLPSLAAPPSEARSD